MRARHREDQIGVLDELIGQGLAAEAGEVDPVLGQRFDGMGARRLAGRGMDPRGGHPHVPAFLDQMAKETLGHRAAADVARADEEDVFHDAQGGRRWNSKIRSNRPQVNRPQRRGREQFLGLSYAGREPSFSFVSDLPESPYPEYIPGIYRFAFLMTGRLDVAGRVVQSTVARAAQRGGEIRCRHRAKRWLFAEAREDCRRLPTRDPALAEHVAGEDGEQFDYARGLAGLFATLPEPERCAMSLFYLYLFEPSELCEVLEVKPRDLGPLLLRGRQLIERQRALCEPLFARVSTQTAA